MIQYRWKNAIITEIINIQDTLLDSDHSLQIATPKVKLAKHNRTKKESRPRYRKPSEQEIDLYNQAVLQYLGTMARSDPGTDFTQIISTGNKAHFDKKTHNTKEGLHYISANTWKLIEEKEAAIAAGDYARSQALSPIIKRMARKDRENMILEQLQMCRVINGKASKQHAKHFDPNESNSEMQKVI